MFVQIYLEFHFEGRENAESNERVLENTTASEFKNCVKYYLWVMLNILHFKEAVWVSVTFTSA